MTTKPSLPLDHDGLSATPTPEPIILRIRRDRIKSYEFAVKDPATGAPVDPTVRGRIIAETLESEMRKLKLALYLHLASLYVRKFSLEIVRVSVMCADYLRRKVQKLISG